MNIAVLVGSLRKESFNRKMAHALIELAPKELNLKLIEIDKLSMYNQDLEASPPEAWVEFRNHIRPVQGVLFLTPEYNRSIPAVLKNAIDIGSRPFGQSVWNGKAGAVMSVSPSKMGGFGANHHLRQAMVALNVTMMQQPEAYISGADKLFDDQGRITDESTRNFAKHFIDSYATLVKKTMAPV